MKKNDSPVLAYILFDLLLIVILLCVIGFIAYKMIEPKLYQDKNSDQICKDQLTIRELEESIKLYYIAIINNDYASIKSMTTMFERKNKSEYSHASQTLSFKEDDSVRVKKAEILGNNVYRCHVLIGNVYDDTQEDLMYEVIVKLYPQSETFKIFNDNIGSKE